VTILGVILGFLIGYVVMAVAVKAVGKHLANKDLPYAIKANTYKAGDTKFLRYRYDAIREDPIYKTYKEDEIERDEVLKRYNSIVRCPFIYFKYQSARAVNSKIDALDPKVLAAAQKRLNDLEREADIAARKEEDRVMLGLQRQIAIAELQQQAKELEEYR
jgi:hypothetical protein